MSDTPTSHTPAGDLPLAGRKPEDMPGHWLLARLGKRVLRPGGRALTEQLLDDARAAPWVAEAAFHAAALDLAQAGIAQLLKRWQAEQAREDQHLQTFDELDFVHYSGQQWQDFHKSHAENVLVHYPDGRTTTGLAAHIAELKPQFVFAPDTRIRQQGHPRRRQQLARMGQDRCRHALCATGSDHSGKCRLA